LEVGVTTARRRDRVDDCGESLSAGYQKWNKIEHRLFSFISKNWRGQPLTSLKVIVNLIAGTTTKKGLKVHAVIGDGSSVPMSLTVTGTTRFCLEDDNVIF
jgi:hypothetical protein